MDQNQFSKLIGTIYDAALDPTQWQNVIDVLTPTLEGRSSFLYKFDTRVQSTTDIFWSSDTDQDYLQTFYDYYIHTNPYPTPIHELPSGSIHDEMVLSRPEARKTEYYNDWARPQGLEPSQVGVKIDIDPDRFLVLGTHVPIKTYDQRSGFYQTTFEKLIPHMKNALQVGDLLQKTHHHRALANASLARLGLAVFLLNRSFQLIEANEAGEEILRQGGLLKVNGRTNVLEASAPFHSRELHAAFAKCQDPDWSHPHDLFPLQSPENGDRFIAWVKRVRQDDCSPPLLGLSSLFARQSHDTLLLIVAKPQSTRRLMVTIIQSFLGLTAAEAKLAVALANGTPLQRYSHQAGISHNTARNQLRSIFEKTGMSSQTELVGYIWKCCHI